MASRSARSLRVFQPLKIGGLDLDEALTRLQAAAGRPRRPADEILPELARLARHREARLHTARIEQAEDAERRRRTDAAALAAAQAELGVTAAPSTGSGGVP